MKKFATILAIMALAMVLLSFLSVFIHTFFNVVSIGLQETIIYLHATVFMLGVVYTYWHDKHVRIDVFYQNFSESKKKQVNLIGSLFLLLPFFVFLFYSSYSYVISSWQKLEGSAEPGGLPAVFLLKSLLLALPVLMILLVLVQLFRKK